MNKKIVIFFGLILGLALVIGGFFYWSPYYKQIRIEKELEKLADFIVNETLKGKTIESKDGELKIEISEEWYIRKEKKDMIGPVYILNQELLKIFQRETDMNASKLIKSSFDSKTGCLITIGYIEERKRFEELEEEIRESIQNVTLISENTFQFKEINSQKALQHTYDTLHNGYWIDFLIPSENKTYVFSMVFNRENIEKCSQEFDKFLSSLQITN